MIVRSQNKKKIINFNQITNIATIFNSRLEQWELYVCYPYCNDAECGYSTIAYYSTEEKAIKVLDMIQDAHCRMEDVKCGAVQAQKQDSFCFNMPQDSEV